MTKKPQWPKARLYPLVARAVEAGAAYGVRCAFKHTDTPTPDSIIEHVEREIMTLLSEEFDFGDN